MGYSLSYAFLRQGNYLQALIAGVETTIALFLVCFVAAMVLGTLLAGLRMIAWRPLQVLLNVYVIYQRNVPALVHMLVWYFGIAAVLPEVVNDFLGDHNPEFIFAAIALSLYSAAFLSEDLRSGLRAIPPGQSDGARALGLGRWQAFFLVILPQAARKVLPPVASQALMLFKNTSVAAAIGVAELMHEAREIETETNRVFEALSIATAVYIIGSLLIMGGGRWLARRT